MKALEGGAMASTKKQVEILFNLKYPIYKSAQAGSINMGASGTKCRKYVIAANAYRTKIQGLANTNPAELATMLRRSMYTIEQYAEIVAGRKLPDDGYEQTKVERQAYKSLCEKSLWSDVRAGFLPYFNPNTFEKFDHKRFSSTFFPKDGLVTPESLKRWNAPELEVSGETLAAYLDKSYSALPDAMRKYVDAAFYPCPNYWDGYTLEQRKRQINDYDLEHNPARQIERKAGWWLDSMDANAWWLAESVSPLHAAMLLSCRNPNRETVDGAETNTNDEMGPEDFRQLKNTFEGASNKQKMLKDWTAYARERNLKIHSWICDWEAWVREADAKAAEQSQQQEPSLVSPAVVRTELQPTAERPTTRHKLRTNSLDAPIEKAIKQAGSTVTAAVFLELRELALNGEKPFTGEVVGDALCYTSDDNKPAKLTKNALAHRLRPLRVLVNSRAETRTSASKRG